MRCFALTLLALGLALVGTNALAQNPFTEVAAEIGLTGMGEAGVPCWFDYDNDGDLDLLRSNRYGGAVKLYINDGGQFTVLQNSGLPQSCDIQNAQPIDFDHDRDIDLFLVGFHSDLMLMVNEGGHYTDRATQMGMQVDDRTRDFTWMDFDVDGYPDMLIEFEHYWKLYRNDHGERFIDVTASSQLPITNDNATFAVADYDLDGDADMYMTRLYDRDYLYKNLGNGRFEDASEETGLIGSAANCGGIFVDINNDKFPDLVTAGVNRHDVWLNQNGEFFLQANVHGADADFEAMGYPNGVRYAAGDMDMDGDYDFMAACPGGTGYYLGENQLLRCDSVVGLQVWFTNMAPEWGLNSMEDGFPRFADYDGDGDLDLTLLQNDSPALLYRNTTNGAGRLEVQVLGPNGEERGWHRRVEIYAHGTQTLIRSGVLTQAAVASSGLNNYFALDENAAYDIQIYLEDGTVLSPESNPELSAVVPSQVEHKVCVTLDGVSVGPGSPAIPSFSAIAYPNPFNAEVSLKFTLTKGANVTVKILDLQGREVSTIRRNGLASGEQEIAWSASRFATGIYFVDIRAGGQRDVVKLMLLK